MVDLVFEEIKSAILKAEFTPLEKAQGLPPGHATDGASVAKMPKPFDKDTLLKITQDYGNGVAEVRSNESGSEQWLVLSGPVVQLKTNLRSNQPVQNLAVTGHGLGG